MTHEIKSPPDIFNARLEGFKPWEYRLNDRRYSCGDFLHEREWSPKTNRYTGRSILSQIVLIYDGGNAEARKHGIHRSYCMMTVKNIADGSSTVYDTQ